MAALASDWLRHFRLLLWNRWTEFNETWWEARSQRPLPSLCFSGRSEKQDGRPGLWLAETFSTSPLKPLNGIQRNLIGSKISTSSIKFVFIGPISQQKCSPWLIPQKGGRLYSGAQYVALWASCYAPVSNDRRHIFFFVLSLCLSACLFVCLSVVNFNIGCNFWAVRDRDFIFGKHTPLIIPFQMTPRSMTLWPWLWPWS